MKKFFSLLFLILLFNSNQAVAQREEYAFHNHPLFTIHVPVKWYSISQNTLNNFFKDQAIKQGLSVNPDWLMYECGFQKNPLAGGISPPIVTVKIEHNKDRSRAILRQLKKLTQEQMSVAWKKAFQELSSEILGKIDSSAEDIIIDRNKNMLRFTSRVNDVQSLTSIHAHNDTLFHIICHTFHEQADFETFRRISDSFIAK